MILSMVRNRGHQQRAPTILRWDIIRPQPQGSTISIAKELVPVLNEDGPEVRVSLHSVGSAHLVEIEVESGVLGLNDIGQGLDVDE